MLSLVNNVHDKTSQEGRTDENFETMDMFFVICTCVIILHLCYNFALVLHENALVITQSEEHNFFMYIIRDVTVCMDSFSMVIVPFLEPAIT